jgi:GTP-binding protein HflX
MIEAFNSTLEELLHADIVLVIIDASDGLYVLQKKFKSCYRTLIEIGVEPDKMIYVLNKSELLTDDEVLDRVDYLMLKENKKWIAISALTGKNMDELEKTIGKIFQYNKSQNNKSVGVKAYGN